MRMLIIGNGESRKNINIDKDDDIKIGCNAIHRDWYVRHLVCADRKMVREAIDNNYNQDSLIYTRNCWFQEFTTCKNIRIIPDLPYVGSERYDEEMNWGSGLYAILLGIKLIIEKGHQRQLRIIGFDLYGTEEGKLNNVYKDTNNYSLSTKSAVNPKYWIIQMAKLMQLYPDIQFVFYNNENWISPKAWKKKNFVLDNINNFTYNNIDK
jgi:hypothetical protein